MAPDRAIENALQGEDPIVLFGPFRFDRRALVLSRDGTNLPIQPKPLAVLRCLTDRPGEVLLKDELMDLVWKDAAVTENSLAEAVRMLRQALGDDPRASTYIETVHRRGYRFIAAVREHHEHHAHDEPHERPGGGARAEATEAAGHDGRQPTVPVGRRPNTAVALVAASLLVGAAATWALTGADNEVPAGDLAYLDITLPDEAPMRVNLNVLNLAISPDGRSVVYEAPTAFDGLYVRHIDNPEVRPIEGTAASTTVRGATISPDGQQVAFFVFEDNPRQSAAFPTVTFRLKSVPLEGGRPLDLATGRGLPTGLGWGPDGTLVYGTIDNPGLWVLPPGRGASPSLIASEHGLFYVWPHVLPDGKTVIATARNCPPVLLCRADDATEQIVAISLDSGQQRVLLDGGGRAKFVSSGHLVIGRDQQLLAAPFDPDAVELYGPLQLVQADVMSTGAGSDAVYFDVSRTGNLVYASGEFARLPGKVRLVSRNGDTEPLPVALRDPQISPDGTTLVGVGRGDLPPDLYLYTLGRGTSLIRLTFGLKIRKPIWTPEGQRLTFAVRGDDNRHHDLYWMAANSSSPPTLLRDTAHDLAPESWSPAGRWLAFTETRPDTIEDIWLLSPDGEAQPFLQTPFVESNAAFSPDGGLIAYHSNESGTFEVYVRPAPEDLDNHDAGGVGYKKQVSTDCGGWPVWARDGSELYFRSCNAGTESFWAVPIETNGSEIKVGEPEFLFEGEWERGRRGPSYSVTPDGRFPLVERAAIVNRLKVVLNWAEELARLVPTGR